MWFWRKRKVRSSGKRGKKSNLSRAPRESERSIEYSFSSAGESIPEGPMDSDENLHLYFGFEGWAPIGVDPGVWIVNQRNVTLAYNY